MMQGTLQFAPLVPQFGLIALAVVVLVLCLLAIVLGLKGWVFRTLAAAMVVLALANLSFVREERETLQDIVLVAVDRSSSQTVSGRPTQTDAALADLKERLGQRASIDLKVIEVPDAEKDGGTLLIGKVAEALSTIPQARLSGVFVISDGQVHDADRLKTVPAPTHLYLTGAPEDWDRRLIVKNAPSFAILGEPLSLTLRLEDQGAAPDATTGTFEISIDGGPKQSFQLPIGQDMSVEIPLPHGGINVLQMSTPTQDGELTDRNNAAVVRVNAVRDRLRVLLVSGEPHAGERTWRNLLKSDNSVDLVHFTILRPPNKFDGVPVTELALIAFPTRELFLEKIDEFDLIVFDRYKRRGLLPGHYFENIANYVRKGGAVLVAAGPDYAGPESLFRSPLGSVLPGAPTAGVFEQPLLPKISDIGARHPVTEGLENPDAPWGRWMRQVDVTAVSGDVLMTGANDAPLLMTDRVGEGRVALLASDHAWLWDRGFEGGGPQRELLRRLSHWMMKEPELEEEALSADELPDGLNIVRRTLSDTPPDNITMLTPGGETITVPLKETSPGRFEALVKTTELGLYRLTSGDQSIVTARGPSAPREFISTISSPEKLQSLLTTNQGGIFRISEGLPRLRSVREGRPAAGRGWVGITPRNVQATTNVSAPPLLPVWLWLLLAAGFMIFGWLREGRR